MTCLGLAPAPCSKLLAITVNLAGPLGLFGRLGTTGSMIALGLFLLRTSATLLAAMFQLLRRRFRLAVMFDPALGAAGQTCPDQR